MKEEDLIAEAEATACEIVTAYTSSSRGDPLNDLYNHISRELRKAYESGCKAGDRNGRAQKINEVRKALGI